MANGTADPSRTQCLNCRFETEPGSDSWGTVHHPPLGTLTQCPECGSTNIRSV